MSAKSGGKAALFLSLFFLSLPARSGEAQADIDLDTAEAQFARSCGTCHTTDPDEPPRQGPHLHGVYGREAGRVGGFAYSEALKAKASEGLVWTEATLQPWITSAGAFIPGTTMLYRQGNPEKRALIIAYLRSLSDKRAKAD